MAAIPMTLLAPSFYGVSTSSGTASSSSSSSSSSFAGIGPVPFLAPLGRAHRDAEYSNLRNLSFFQDVLVPKKDPNENVDAESDTDRQVGAHRTPSPPPAYESVQGVPGAYTQHSHEHEHLEEATLKHLLALSSPAQPSRLSMLLLGSSRAHSRALARAARSTARLEAIHDSWAALGLDTRTLLAEHGPSALPPHFEDPPACGAQEMNEALGEMLGERPASSSAQKSKKQQQRDLEKEKEKEEALHDAWASIGVDTRNMATPPPHFGHPPRCTAAQFQAALDEL